MSPCTVSLLLFKKKKNPLFYFHPYCLCLSTASHIVSRGSLLSLPLISTSLIQHSRQPWVLSCLKTTLIILLPYLKPTSQLTKQPNNLKTSYLVPKSFSTSKSQLLILPVSPPVWSLSSFQIPRKDSDWPNTTSCFGQIEHTDQHLQGHLASGLWQVPPPNLVGDLCLFKQ